MLSQTSNPIGGHGIGVVQPQSGLDYPFVAPNLGFNSELLSDVRNLFADFYLSYDDPGYYNGVAVKNPLKIYWLYGFGSAPAWSKGAPPNSAIVVPADPPHAVDLIVVDADENVVFDTSTADLFTSQDWGGQYKIYEWVKTTKPGEKICRAVVFSSVHPDIPPPNVPVQFCPRNAVLDERTINKIPKRVLAMRVQNGACVSPWFKNKVTMVNGYNTTINMGETETENLRRQTVVTFAAAAGAGRGKYGDCPAGDCLDDEPTNVCPPGEDPLITICEPENGEKITSFNGGDGGNLLISGKDCVWARYEPAYIGGVPQNYMTDPTTGEPKRAAIGIGADCKPCCDCEDYLETAKYLKRVADRYTAIGDRVTAAKTGHENNILRWSDQRKCRLKSQLRVLLFPQSCSDLKCIEVVPIYCNQCFDCANNTALTLQMDFSGGKPLKLVSAKYADNPPTDSLSPCCPSSRVEVGGTWPTYQIFMPSSNKGESSAARLRFCICAEGGESVIGVVTATLSGATNGDEIRDACDGAGTPIIATAQKSIVCE